MINVGMPAELNISSNKVIEFYKNEWKRPIALGDSKFYRWQFISVPSQENLDHCCIAVFKDDIIGVMGVNKRPFYLNGKEIDAGELTTWIVKPEFRNKGVGPKIIDYLMNKYDILVGMGITDAALPVYLRKGFKYLSAIPRYIKVIDWQKVEGSAEYEPLAKKVTKLYEKRVKTPYIVKEANRLNINQVFNNFSKSNNMFSRSYDYIAWRYLEHPTFNYELNVIFNENCSGKGVLVATRAEEASNGLTIMHIIDFYGDEQDFSAGLDFIIEKAEQKYIDVIDFFSTSSSLNSHFIKDGWLSTLDHKFFKLPHLFQPIELREPLTTSLIYWYKEDEVSFYDFSKLYITKQDTDFDRPTLKKDNE